MKTFIITSVHGDDQTARGDNASETQSQFGAADTSSQGQYPTITGVLRIQGAPLGNTSNVYPVPQANMSSWKVIEYRA